MFFERARYGGILCDLGSHQVEQFLFFTGSTAGEVVPSQVGSFANPATPGLEDFAGMELGGPHATRYVRPDWPTPGGLGTWSDGRAAVQGTDGHTGLGKYIDIAGRPGADHLFLADPQGARHLDCSRTPLPYGPAFASGTGRGVSEPCHPAGKPRRGKTRTGTPGRAFAAVSSEARRGGRSR